MHIGTQPMVGMDRNTLLNLLKEADEQLSSDEGAILRQQKRISAALGQGIDATPDRQVLARLEQVYQSDKIERDRIDAPTYLGQCLLRERFGFDRLQAPT